MPEPTNTDTGPSGNTTTVTREGLSRLKIAWPLAFAVTLAGIGISWKVGSDYGALLSRMDVFDGKLENINNKLEDLDTEIVDYVHEIDKRVTVLEKTQTPQ